MAFAEEMGKIVLVKLGTRSLVLLEVVAFQRLEYTSPTCPVDELLDIRKGVSDLYILFFGAGYSLNFWGQRRGK